MRKILVAAAASVAILLAIGLVADRANAMTLTTPSGVRAAIDSTNLAQDVRWVCRYHLEWPAALLVGTQLPPALALSPLVTHCRARHRLDR